MSDNRVTTRADVIRSSYIVVKEGCMPTRVVLRDLGHEYVVHNEHLTTEAPSEGHSCNFRHRSFEVGDYFSHTADGLAKARARFEERAAKL